MLLQAVGDMTGPVQHQLIVRQGCTSTIRHSKWDEPCQQTSQYHQTYDSMSLLAAPIRLVNTADMLLFPDLAEISFGPVLNLLTNMIDRL
jgi:hypothetical protein